MKTEQCGLCGHAVPWPDIIYDEGRILCPACQARMGTCSLCEEAKHCIFHDDTTCTLPKVEIKTIKQGNHTIQMQVRGEARVKELCPKCTCWNQEEQCCNREFQNCGKWHEIHR